MKYNHTSSAKDTGSEENGMGMSRIACGTVRS